MPYLTDDERAEIIECLLGKDPLPRKWLEKLFPPDTDGELLWPGKHQVVSLAEQWTGKAASSPHSSLVPVPPSSAPGAQGMPTVLTMPTMVDVSNEQNLSDGKNVPDDWQGIVFQGDNKKILQYLMTSHTLLGLPQSPFSFIYIDPPFFAGTDFHIRIPRAMQGRGQSENLTDINDTFAYSDTWQNGKGQYFSMLYSRLFFMRQLLSSTGVLCVHCDWRAGPGIRFILDECFGPQAFVNEIIWHYTGGGRSKKYFSRKHDCLLVYAKGKEWTYNIDAVRVPYKKTSGYAKSGITSKAGKRYLPHPLGTPADDVWDIPMLNPMANERVAYATQKPLALLERLIQAFTDEGDLVGDFFCGSGTTLVAAASLKRRFVGCDFGKQAVQVTASRLEGLALKKQGMIIDKSIDSSFFLNGCKPQNPAD